MVKAGIIGYTPLNGHPFSFGCIINGFNDQIVIPSYEPITRYLRENIKYASGIEQFTVDSVYSSSINPSQIANIIGAKPYSSYSNFLNSCHMDLIFILTDYSRDRNLMILDLLERGYKVFVDKPLSQSLDELFKFKPFIELGQLYSSSMYRFLDFNPSLYENCQHICSIEISRWGNWDNYHPHSLDPICQFIKSNELSVSWSSKTSASVTLKTIAK